MERIKTPTRAPNKFGNGPFGPRDGFTDGNPTTGLASTQLEADHFDHVQEEICRVIEDAGINPDGSRYTMLLEALRAFIDPPADGQVYARRRMAGQPTGEWVLSGRRRLTANLNIFVSNAGNDSNDGLSGATAFLTIQRAVRYLMDEIDVTGFTATINVAAGTYAGFNFNGPVVGQNIASISIVGQVGNPGSCIINATGGPAAINAINASFFMRGFRIQGTVQTGLFLGLGSYVEFDGAMEFGPVLDANIESAHIGCAGGYLQVSSPYTIVQAATGTGNAAAHIRIQSGGAVVISANCIVGAGVGGFANFLALTDGGSRFNMAPPFVYIGLGNAAGFRYDCRNNANIDVGARSANAVLPGSVNGTWQYGGAVNQNSPQWYASNPTQPPPSLAALSLFDAVSDEVTPVKGSLLAPGPLPTPTLALLGYTLRIAAAGTPPADSNAPQVPMETGDMLVCIESDGEYVWAIIEPDGGIRS